MIISGFGILFNFRKGREMTIKDVVDIVLKIREQDVQFYGSLLTIFAGTFLVACIVSTIGKGVPKGKMPAILALLSILCFVAFLLFSVRVAQRTKREFCTKWLANHVTSGERPEQLLEKFLKSHYALACPEPPIYVVDPNDRPAIRFQALALGKGGAVTLICLPTLSGILLFCALFWKGGKKPDSE